MELESIDYQFIFRSSPESSVLLNEQLTILDATDTYATITSKSREELIGKNLFEAFPVTEESDGTFGLHEHLDEVIRTKKAASSRILRYDISDENKQFNSRFWKPRSVPLLQNGQIRYIVHSAQDVTEIVRNTQTIEPRENIFKMVVDNIRDYAIFLLDIEGRIRTWNLGAKKIKLYEATEIIGKHFSIFYSDEDIKSKKPEKELEIVRQEGRVEDENWRKRKDGTYFWANVIITAIRNEDDKLIGYAKITRDLTERKMNEENIILAYQESAKLKSEFLANMSHEIRTPMNGIMSAANLLEDSSSNLTKEQQELVGIIQTSGKSMVKLINDILDYTKMESDRIYIISEPFDLYKEMEEIMYNYEALIIKPIKLNLSVSNTVPRFLKGDRLRFHQVLSNIVDNAIKFTEEGSINVSVNLVDDDKNHHPSDHVVLKFEIKDTGIGIKEDDLKKLFNPFSQLEKFTTKRFKGTGLGLAICKRLVELMHGEISIDSKLGEGTTVTFTISFKESIPHVPHDKPEETKKSNLRALNPDVKILVAEDNPVNQNVVLRVLKRLGYKNVTLAENGKQAVELYDGGKYDMILMDIQMPIMDGYQATASIRKVDPKVPIIAMTANALKGDAEKCIAAGMNDYISKPIDMRLFTSLLNHWSNP